MSSDDPFSLLRSLEDPAPTTPAMSPPPSLDALRTRRTAILDAARRHALVDVRVFGSVATGRATPESDLDLLVRLGPGADWLSPELFREEVEALLGCRVDVATDQYIRPHVAATALPHARPL